jgi:formate dehydrogenase (coenzyme F420) beta subunit
MPIHASIEVNIDPVSTVRELIRQLLSENAVEAVFALAKTPYGHLPMPTLVTDPAKVETADPFAPAAPFNAARQAVMVLRHATPGTTLLILKPCEIRALVELVKLNQCTLENAVIVGFDCLGRMENADYLSSSGQDETFSNAFLSKPALQTGIATTCASCTAFLPDGADIAIRFLGDDPVKRIGISAMTPKGEAVVKALGLTETSPCASREMAITQVMEARQKAKTVLFEETSAAISSMEGFQKKIASCLNCYNCRQACPVCYCNECVFLTDVFRHDPEILLNRAKKRGAVKLPPDTAMFHLTRLAHIGHACVGCGHCTSVCPSGISVADIFRTVSENVQSLLGYVPGRDKDEPIPYLVFEGSSHSTKGAS